MLLAFDNVFVNRRLYRLTDHYVCSVLTLELCYVKRSIVVSSVCMYDLVMIAILTLEVLMAVG